MSAHEPTGPAVLPRRWGLIWAFSFAGWLGIWMLMTFHMYIYSRSRGEPLSWTWTVSRLSEHLLWGVITPGILWLCWRFPLSAERWRSAVPLNMLVAVSVSAAFVFPVHWARLFLSHALAEPGLYQAMSWTVFTRVFVGALLLYIDPFLAAQAIHYAREVKTRELRASRLEARLAEAQLQVLRMQLHPHFLFNTLHTISALMHKDVKAADRMLALLGDLLRDSFDKIGAQEVSLQQELGFLHRYLEIERTRFRDRLAVETDIDPETLDAEVPNLILQPLLENAIRHGIERRMGAGRIRLAARREGARLLLTIQDDGPGLPPEAELAFRRGIGLANTQARLNQLYGTDQSFELLNRPEGGLEVALSIPFRLRPPDRETSRDRSAVPGTAQAAAIAPAAVR
jgi:signal transduction histidine kinase